MTPYANHIAVIRRLLRAGALGRAEKVLDKIPPADLGTVMSSLDPTEARPLCVLLLSPARVHRSLKVMPAAQVGHLLAPLSDAEVVKILDRMPGPRAAEVMAVLPAERRERVRSKRPAALSAAADVATVMGRHGLALPVGTSAQDAIEAIRRSEHPSDVFYLYVLDAGECLNGVVALRLLVTSPADRTLGSLMTPNPVTVRVDSSAEEAARKLSAHGFLALPVVDHEGHLVGVVNADDVFELMADAAQPPAPEPAPTAPAEAPPAGSAWTQWFPFLTPRRARGSRATGKAALVGALLLATSGAVLSVL